MLEDDGAELPLYRVGPSTVAILGVVAQTFVFTRGRTDGRRYVFLLGRAFARDTPQ